MSASRSTVHSTDTFSDVSIQQARSKVVTVAVVHPGWVQSDLAMTSGGGWGGCAKNVPQITTAHSSAGVVAIAKKVTIDSTASFYNYDGSKLPFLVHLTCTLSQDNDM